MPARGFGLIALLIVTGVGSTLAEKNDAPVIVDLRAHRGEIRTVLLRHTPLGSSETRVREFISKQLQRSGDTAVTSENQPADGTAAVGSRLRGVKRIKIYLGQYYDHPEVIFLSAPLVMQREVTAQWAFDQHDRLIEIFVDKTNGLY